MLLAACTDSEPVVPPVELKLSLATEEVTVSSAKVKVTAEEAEEYAYLLIADGQGEFPEPEALFRENEHYPIAQTEILLRDLEAKTAYTLAVVARGGADGTELVCEKVQFTTTDFTNVLTFTGIEKNKIAFHVACGPDQHWRWVMYRYMDYVDRRAAFWPVESRMLPTQGDPQQGPATIEVEQTDAFKILPGEKYILLVAECDADGNYLYEKNEQGGGGGGPAPLSTRSLEGGDEYIDDDATWSGFYCRRIFLSEKPETTTLETKVEEVKVTTRNATFRLTPDEGVYGFAAGIIQAATYEEYKAKYSEEAMHGYISYMHPFNVVASEISYQDLQEGEYYILISTFADAEASAQNIQIVPFRRIVPTKPKAQLVVTGIEAPAGETASGPNYCWFNLKAPNKDAVYGTYLSMEHQAFLNQIQFGATAEQLVSDFILQAQFTPEVLDGINSDAGYNLCLNAWEDTQYVLLAGIANDEDVVTVVTGMNHTAPLPAEPRVESPLFDELQGAWTVKATSVRLAEDGTWQDYLRLTTKSTIHTAPPLDDVPATIPDAVYEAYANASVGRPMVDAFYRDFIDLGEKIGKKYRGWNRLVACGLELGWGSGWGQCWTESEYRSPWGLFSATDYNGSGNLDIYRDFGPKLFFHVGEGDEVTVIGNTQTAGTVSDFNRQMCVFAVPEDLNNGSIQAFDLVEFPVEISADGSTMTIKPFEDAGKKYYFALGKAAFGGNGYDIVFRAKDDVVFTKGWTGEDDKTIVEDLTVAEPAATAASMQLRLQGKTPTRVSPQHALPSTYRPTVYRKVEGRIYSIDELTSDPTIENYVNRR